MTHWRKHPNAEALFRLQPITADKLASLIDLGWSGDLPSKNVPAFLFICGRAAPLSRSKLGGKNSPHGGGGH